MFWHRKVKKGYVLIYTLLICTLSMIIVLYIFNMEIKKTKNIASYKNYISSNKHDEDKEYLFTIISEDIKNHVLVLNYDNVKKYLIENQPNYRTKDNKAKIEYDSISDKIVFTTHYEKNYIKVDIFDYVVILEKLKLSYVKTLYKEGIIE